MDLTKTGNLISSVRKEKGLTQKQLAEILCVSEKTVSKWECGAGMPDVSLMLPLCKVLKIDVNELLTGEKLEEKNYKVNAENNLLKLIDKTSSKVKYTICAISIIITIFTSVALTMVASFAVQESWLRILMIFLMLLLIFSNIAVIVLVAVNTEVYECRHCGEKFVPTIGAYVMAPHTLTRRKLKCPHCHKKGWNKFYFVEKLKEE